MFVFALAVVFKLCSIQFIQGEQYRALAIERSIEDFDIEPNRGNVYSADGSLLATSIPKYDIRIDAVQAKDAVFDEHIGALADSLSVYKGKPSSHYKDIIRKARGNKNRYFLLARNISYSEYIRMRNFPLLSLGAIKGGLIVEQTTRREHPMGEIAARSIGYERVDENNYATRVGIDGAFGEKYLRGVKGKRLKQKIGNGQWKPIADFDQVEPQDGYDVYTTIDVNIQDIAHHSLLGQLEEYKADHGCVVVMDVKTGEIKPEGGSITEGIGNSRITANMADAPIDDAIQVDDPECLRVVNQLLRKDGLFMGGSVGINVGAAYALAKKLGPGHTIVTVLCDGGARYQSKLFNPEWLATKGLTLG